MKLCDSYINSVILTFPPYNQIAFSLKKKKINKVTGRMEM